MWFVSACELSYSDNHCFQDYNGTRDGGKAQAGCRDTGGFVTQAGCRGGRATGGGGAVGVVKQAGVVTRGVGIGRRAGL